MLAQQNYRLSSPPAHPLGATSSVQRSNASQALSRSRSRDVLRSVSASRSTSRSHSPMPLTTDSPQLSPARRIRPLFTEDPPLEPYIPALQEIVSLAMEVVNTSIEALASRTGACSEIISKVQTVGRVWDEHPDWPRRGCSPALEPFTSRRVVSESDRSRLIAAHLAQDQAAEQQTRQTTDEEKRVTLQAAAETSNVLIELSLDDETLLYVSPAWRIVVGSDPSDVLDRPIADLLAPGDVTTFAEAREQLQVNDSHTVEAAFRLRIDRSMVQISEDEDEATDYYQEMEGKGMLMRDRQSGQASHTMWVFKPMASPEPKGDLSPRQQKASSDAGEPPAVVNPAIAINTDPLLCRIFPIITPHPSNEPPSALEMATRAISPRHPHAASVRKQHLRALDSLLEALRSAVTISTPAVKEDVAEQPIEKQRLLSPESEGKVGHARNWRRPTVEDGGLDTLAMDVESAIKVKISAVTRMLNTIIYVETVRQEWEARVEAALADAEGSDTDGTSGQSSRGADEDAAGVNETTLDRVHDLSAALEVSEPDSNEDEEDGHTSGILLERDDRGLPSFSSSEPSPSPGVGDDDDIPGVESQMGGVADAHALPIPISGGLDNSATQSEKAPQQAQSRRKGVNTTSTLQTRRMSTLSQPGVVHTPPLSPRQLPELAGSAGKVRRISLSQRNSPQLSASAAVSPRLPPMAPSSRPTASSIKDFDILKPISKGAFGSVFLAKKRTTGDYYAIKVLKKSDMIAKNQIRNVKAERMILMTQTQSPFVVKLFFTFQSAEYLYLVMEYLPGGDCASLCKALGGLPEEWARIFVAEVVIGLEQLHKQGVVHRDMKPDNLLIDQKGHLKLTDFGLSKYGLLGRQTRGTMRPHHGRSSEGRHAKDDSTGSGSASGSASGSGFGPGSLPTSATSVGTPLSRNGSQKLSSPWRAVASPTTPGLSNVVQSQAFYTGPLRGRIISDAGSSTASETTHDAPASRRDLDSPAAPRNKIVPVPSSALLESPGQIFGSNALAESFQALNTNSGGSGQPLKKFVGTPDYLAPESILGIGMDDMAVDWWAVGVILYEFLYGYPPFHAETPEKVFDNILSRNIDWEDGAMDYSPSARNLMERLMSSDPKDRLGTRGADEIKAHPFFAGIDWQALSDGEGPFVPQVTDPESTDYFDLRGAVHQEFSGEIERSRSEGMPALTQTLEQPLLHARHRSLSGKHGRGSVGGSQGASRFGAHPGGPPSPSNSASSQGSGPSRSTAPTSPAAVQQAHAGSKSHRRLPSELIASSPGSGNTPSSSGLFAAGNQASSSTGMDRRRSQLAESVADGNASPRRISLPLRLHTDLLGSPDRPSLPSNWRERRQAEITCVGEGPAASMEDALVSTTAETVTCLVAEDNPISLRMLESILRKLGCQCSTVRNGAEAVRLAMGDVKYAVLFVDVSLPIVNGQDVARMVKSTRNINSSTPIVALASFDRDTGLNASGSVFDAVLAKPLELSDVCEVLPRLGFTKQPPRRSAGSMGSAVPPSDAESHPDAAEA
ncbi:related to serine threonine protein kinase [Ceraceosorus bombacis]|uniref:non-specific serine/threonine protein kinase n=1 Tax=Ceraceosorus bombacis TaxID=401625 RepID=A0A0P1BHN6_9BASI|nr:related to serine threonine protein kinase [Ceraceosorus bombacis]